MPPTHPDFDSLANSTRGFTPTDRRLAGVTPTIAITPVADGRLGAYESNAEKTWRMVERVYRLITENVRLPDGAPVRVVVPPEIVYGARTGALAQEYYTTRGVSANIWVSRSWAYSDELLAAAQGLGSSEWQQAAYGLNQTDRPGAVWLKAFCAAMDEKERPIFAIYNPDLENEDEGIPRYVSDRLLLFARAAAAVAEMRGKNYLSVGGVSMGIIGSDVRRNLLQHYFGMGAVSVDMVEVRARMDEGFYDHDELERAFKFMKERFSFDFGAGSRPQAPDDLLRDCIRMTLIVRDLMTGNARLADPEIAGSQGFTADIERAQGHHAIAAGTQGQRAWTDHYPNFDLTESLLNSSFDWNGFRESFTVATENDSKNALGMLAARLLSGMPQLFADIRTNWSPESILDATGVDIESIAPGGFIDKRNSGAGALDFAVDVMKLASDRDDITIQEVAEAIRTSDKLRHKLMDAAIGKTTYTAAVLEYFRGDGLSSRYRTPGGIPVTAYRYNAVGDMLTCSVIEGETIELPDTVADHVSNRTDPTWPETFWVPWELTSFEYMRRIGPNHDANSFGLLGPELITLNAMLRIPVDLHNLPESQIFRPTIWDRFGGDDFQVCRHLGPLYR